MSENFKRIESTSPKAERWLIVMACSFLPVIAALFVPQAVRVPLVAVAGVIFISGFVLMLRQSRQSSGTESLRRIVRSDLE
jgi:xanthine/uracil/vitamin C permease (AzgA family)